MYIRLTATVSRHQEFFFTSDPLKTYFFLCAFGPLRDPLTEHLQGFKIACK